jgi:predicted solute-binding protein
MVVAIANRLYEVSPRAWLDLLAVARAEEVTLLALVYSRLREVRDAAARVAFERQTTIAEVAREWRALTRRRQTFATFAATQRNDTSDTQIARAAVEVES